jgi:outer membrane protein OmpA-like peptidoglycan-associated protein
VKIFLVDRGVAASRLDTEGFGESSPSASNETRIGRAENRRAELPLVFR